MFGKFCYYCFSSYTEILLLLEWSNAAEMIVVLRGCLGMNFIQGSNLVPVLCTTAWSIPCGVWCSCFEHPGFLFGFALVNPLLAFFGGRVCFMIVVGLGCQLFWNVSLALWCHHVHLFLLIFLIFTLINNFFRLFKIKKQRRESSKLSAYHQRS